MKMQTDDLYYVKSNNIINPAANERKYVLTKDTINRINTKSESITREVIFTDTGKETQNG